MKYVVYHRGMDKYLGFLSSDFIASWVDQSLAHRFESKQKIDNFMKHNFSASVKKQIPRSEVEVLPCNDNQPVVGLSKADVELTSEQAEQYLEALPDMMSQMYETGKIIRVLLCYYSEQVRNADKAQEDMLHKIEFSKANVVDGFRLYKGLQEIRLRRRKYKDVCEMLSLVHKSGTIASLLNLQSNCAKFQSNLESRTYTPRILDELFQNITTAKLDTAIDSKLADIFESEECKS